MHGTMPEYVGLSELLDQDISSYEYFYSLPEDLQNKIIERDIASFDDMVDYVSEHKQYDQR